LKFDLSLRFLASQRLLFFFDFACSKKLAALGFQSANKIIAVKMFFPRNIK